MPKDQSSSTHSKFYRQIGTHGWRESDYFTFSVRSPVLRRWIAAQLPAKRMEILSVGCGTGEVENHLSELRHQVVGLDLSHPMLQRASRNGLGLPVQADARFLPFGSASFDTVMFLESIGHLPLDDVFKESRRVLKKRGRLLVTTYAGHLAVHPRYSKFRMGKIADRLVDAGFRIDEQRYLDAKQSKVIEMASEHQATLLYVMSTRQD